MQIPFKYNDGGRSAAGFKGDANDCVTRAVAIVTGKPYRAVYNEINAMGAKERGKNKTKSSARTGVSKRTTRRYLASLGFIWTPTMFIGSGCKVHLQPGELPLGKLIVQLSGHTTTVIDGVIHDTYNPSRWGNRCVYGYYSLHQ